MGNYKNAVLPPGDNRNTRLHKRLMYGVGDVAIQSAYGLPATLKLPNICAEEGGAP
jgi:hypothetical protein